MVYLDIFIKYFIINIPLIYVYNFFFNKVLFLELMIHDTKNEKFDLRCNSYFELMSIICLNFLPRQKITLHSFSFSYFFRMIDIKIG